MKTIHFFCIILALLFVGPATMSPKSADAQIAFAIASNAQKQAKLALEKIDALEKRVAELEKKFSESYTW